MSESKKVVLIVDDIPENIAILHQILRNEYKTKAAINGEKALLVANKEPIPDLILLDILMPSMDGYEVFRQCKANPNTAHIPVIFVTGKETDEDHQAGLALGAVDYISKPVMPNVVLEKIKKYI